MKNLFQGTLLTLVTFFIIVYNFPDDDLMSDSIPNYPDTFNQRAFAGYLKTESQSRMLHYVFLQHENGASNTQPILIWMNGGPGCSSKLGMLQEIGPYFLPLNTPYENDMTLTANPFSWLRAANLLFIDFPAGVGFSINNDASYQYNDKSTAADNLAAVQNFLTQKFPQYLNNILYLAGQSYAGKYIPDLATAINDYNQRAQQKINLQGILIGNGVMSFLDESLLNNQIQFIIDHNFIDPKMLSYWDSCKIDRRSASCNFFMQKYSDLLDKIDTYNIYGPCFDTSSISQESMLKKLAARTMWRQQKECNSLQETLNPNGCFYDQGIKDYFTTHYTDFHSKKKTFQACNQSIFNSYTISPSGSMQQYGTILDKGDLRVYLYTGDWDDIVPYTDTEDNLQLLGLKRLGITQNWIQNQQHIGFIKKYSKGVYLYIVKGAGHQVPIYQRQAAYIILDKFLFY